MNDRPVWKRLLLAYVGGVAFGLGALTVALVALQAWKADVPRRVLDRVAMTAAAVGAVAGEAGKTGRAGEKEPEPLLQDPVIENPALDLPPGVQVPIPEGHAIHVVRSSRELLAALRAARERGGDTAIVLEDGLYKLFKTVTIKSPNIMLLSKSADPRRVVIEGRGMRRSSRVENLIKVKSSGFVLDGITLRRTGNHLIQIAAEDDADIPVIRNCILQDAYEQIIKVSYNKDTPQVFSDSGLVENCVLEYTQGIAPNYYVGGIDAHGIRNWVIRNNLFRDIASPGERIAEHAIHLWNNTSNNLVEGNVIVDSDRGIGFGMQKRRRHPNIRYSNYGGIIRNNIIFHSDNGDPFADTGIILEDSPMTRTEGNWIYLAHDYPRAIEYRFPTTRGVVIRGNRSNKAIASRNGGTAAVLEDNDESIDRSRFLARLNVRLRELNMPEMR